MENWKGLTVFKYKNQTVGSRQFKGSSAIVDKEDNGVLCCWFSLVHGSVNVFQICDETDEQGSVHSYIPISSYLCTTTSICVQYAIDSSSENVNSSIMPILSSQKKMAIVQ